MGIFIYDDPAEEAAFLAWYEERCANPGFSEIKSNIVDIISNAPDRQLSHDDVLPRTLTCFWLVREFFKSCWEALNFQQHGDPLKCEHQSYADAEETRAVIADLASKLSGRLQVIAKDQDHPLWLNLWAASRVLEKSNKGIKIERTDWPEAIATLARTMRNVPVEYSRTHRACLEYADPIKSGRNVSVATALANDTMTPHGFRAMARTILDEVLGVRVDYIEHQLAHAVKDANGRSYNRTAHLDGRREMMQNWADYLDALKAQIVDGNLAIETFTK